MHINPTSTSRQLRYTMKHTHLALHYTILHVDYSIQHRDQRNTPLTPRSPSNMQQHVLNRVYKRCRRRMCPYLFSLFVLILNFLRARFRNSAASNPGTRSCDSTYHSYYKRTPYTRHFLPVLRPGITSISNLSSKYVGHLDTARTYSTVPNPSSGNPILLTNHNTALGTFKY